MLSYLVASDNGNYQTITINFEVNLKNSTDGNTMQRLLEIKDSNTSAIVRMPSIINEGRITDMIVQSYIGNKVRIVLSDDKGSVHIIDNKTLIKSVSVSNQPIVGLGVNQHGTVYFTSKNYVK